MKKTNTKPDSQSGPCRSPPAGEGFLAKPRNTPGSKAENSLRIIGGQWRSRKLTFPDAEGLRPTADRVRETLFNWLQNTIQREDCLDLFAGSGACGIEALSRGARHVTFIDSSSPATNAIRDNLRLLQAQDHTVICDDSLRWLQGSTRRAGPDQYGLVFIDPPFASNLMAASAAALEASNLLRADALIYLESAHEIAAATLPPAWQVLKSKRAGLVYFYLCQRNFQRVVET